MNHYENFLAMIKEASIPYTTYEKDERDYIVIYPEDENPTYFVFRSTANHPLITIYD